MNEIIFSVCAFAFGYSLAAIVDIFFINGRPRVKIKIKDGCSLQELKDAKRIIEKLIEAKGEGNGLLG